MKTIKISTTMIGIIALLVVNMNFANAEKPPKMNSNQFTEVQKELDRHITFPDEARQYGITGTVKAQLVVTCEGKLEVEAIQGQEDLTKYVRKQIESITLNDISLTGTVFIASFDFRN